MTISVNLNEAQALLVTKYAELNGVSIPEIVTHFTPLLNLTPQEIEDILSKIAKELELKKIYK